MRNIDDIERLAMKNELMPEGLKLPEQLVYLSLRHLHEMYREGRISREQARAEKIMLEKQYKDAAFWFSVWDEVVHRRNKAAKLLPEIDDHGCELCRKYTAIMSGRE